MMNPDKFRVLMKFLEKVDDEDNLQCKYCHEAFENTNLLQKHSITKHTEKRLVCDFCLKELTSLSGMIGHMKSHMHITPTKEVTTRPPQRTQSFDYEPESVSESEDSDYDRYDDEGKRNKKPDRQYPRQCDHCEFEVPMKKVHYHHYLIMHADILDQYPYRSINYIPCSYCGVLKIFSWFGYATSVLENINVKDLGLEAHCKMCVQENVKYPESVQSKSHIKDHEKRHTGVKIKCLQCDKQFASRNLVMRHIRVVHPQFKLMCDYCSKEFKARNELIRHIRIHTGEKPFKCHICGAGFAHSGNRQIHIRSAHQNIKQVSANAKRNSEKKEKIEKKKLTKAKRDNNKKDKVCVKRNKKMKIVDSDSESDNEALCVIQNKKLRKRKK